MAAEMGNHLDGPFCIGSRLRCLMVIGEFVRLSRLSDLPFHQVGRHRHSARGYLRRDARRARWCRGGGAPAAFRTLNNRVVESYWLSHAACLRCPPSWLSDCSRHFRRGLRVNVASRGGAGAWLVATAGLVHARALLGEWVVLDTLTPAQRSERMKRVRSRDTTPEMRVRRLLHRMGYRYRLHRRDLPGTPDMMEQRAQDLINAACVAPDVSSHIRGQTRGQAARDEPTSS